jgi:DNA-binding beta-propeller fold protein YncE
MKACLAVSSASFALSLLLLVVPTTSRADNLYVSYWRGGIEKFDLATGADLGAFASSGLVDPLGLAFDSAGNLYVANGQGNDIMKFTPGGVGSVFATGLSNPYGLCFGPNGYLYTADYGNNTVDKISPGGVVSVFASTGLNFPQGLAIDEMGDVYVGNYGSYTIEKFSSTGTDLGVFAATGGNPQGLAFDSESNLYVAEFVGDTIEKFTPSGAGSAFNTGLSSPTGLAFDSTGNLYVSNFYGGISKIAPNGVVSDFANSAQATFCAIQVPEPSTCALLTVGLSALLPLRRRRASGASVYR